MSRSKEFAWLIFAAVVVFIISVLTTRCQTRPPASPQTRNSVEGAEQITLLAESVASSELESAAATTNVVDALDGSTFAIVDTCPSKLRTLRNSHPRKGQSLRFYSDFPAGVIASLWISVPRKMWDISSFVGSECWLYAEPVWQIPGETTWDVRMPNDEVIVAQAIGWLDGRWYATNPIGLLVGR